MPDTTYILARDFHDFHRLVKAMGLHLCYCEFVEDKSDLIGKRIGYALATERYYENPSYTFDFLDRLKCGCRMIFVEGELP